ncbi:hypothetical protein HK098_007797 [Nowakowskiella sp. JEL0407]|nr:hypothetical protein HK098_007797 [Nowakowskiella sp. JEL0407]
MIEAVPMSPSSAKKTTSWVQIKKVDNQEVNKTQYFDMIKPQQDFSSVSSIKVNLRSNNDGAFNDISQHQSVQFVDFNRCLSISGEFSENHDGKVCHAFFTDDSGNIIASLTQKPVSTFSVPSSVHSTPSLTFMSSPMSTPDTVASTSGMELETSEFTSFGLDAMPMWNDMNGHAESMDGKWFDSMSSDEADDCDDNELFSEFLKDGCFTNPIKSTYTEETKKMANPIQRVKDSDTMSVLSSDSGCDAMYIPEGDGEDNLCLSINQTWYREMMEQQFNPVEIFLSCIFAVKISTTHSPSHTSATIPDSMEAAKLSALEVKARQALRSSHSLSESYLLNRPYSVPLLQKSHKIGLGVGLNRAQHRPKISILSTLGRKLGPSVNERQKPVSKLGASVVTSSKADAQKSSTVPVAIPVASDRTWAGNSITIPSSPPNSLPKRPLGQPDSFKPQTQHELLQLLLQHKQPQANMYDQQWYTKWQQAAEFMRVQQNQQVDESANLAARLAAKFQPCAQTDSLPGDLFM